MQETIFYMGIQVSKQFDLEKEWLTIDNYYDAILEITKEYYAKGYGEINEGPLECVNVFINDNLTIIKNILVKYNVSETKKWE